MRRSSSWRTLVSLAGAWQTTKNFLKRGETLVFKLGGLWIAKAGRGGHSVPFGKLGWACYSNIISSKRYELLFAAGGGKQVQLQDYHVFE
jgi:hypothetical protein